MRTYLPVLAIALALVLAGCAGVSSQPTSDIPESGHGPGAFSDGGYDTGGGGHLRRGAPRTTNRSFGNPGTTSTTHSGALQTNSNLPGVKNLGQPRHYTNGRPTVGLVK